MGKSAVPIERSMKKLTAGQPRKVKLERVLGLTVTTNAALDCEPHTGLIAYPAGCTVVLLHSRRAKQWHLINNSKNTLTAVAFSPCGRYLATGECGHQPCLRVWDLQDKTQVAEFPGHKYGINCVAFSPNNKYVVSVGSQHDMIVNVWEWRGQVKVASNKVSAKVKAISFAENGSYFVTVGNRHVKFWYLEYSRSNKYKEPVPLMGRSAILGEQRNNYFCDVACGRGEMGDSTYAITKSGLLCEFNNRRLLDKWVELRTKSANCLVVGEEYIFIGCADGIVRCFSPYTLQFVTTLPRTHYLGVDVSKGLSISHMASHPANSRYPDTIAVTYDSVNHKVSCVYADHSIYIWDTKDIRKVGKSHSFLYHSACIWGIDTYPNLGEGSKGLLPPGSFITCSSDDTIRVWNMDPNMSNSTLYKRNIYSNELLKTLYVDPELQHLCCVEYNPAGSADKTDTFYDSRNGVRSIRVSPDGKHLASGDRSGNIRIHELQFMDEICKIEAHDAEVLCLEYSKGNSSPKLLASASRDRLIHVFDTSRDYQFLQTLGDHSSSITAVRFLKTREEHPLQMLSCGADKSIIFRQAQKGSNGMTEFSRSHHVVGKSTLYDMEVDPNQRHLLTACQDRSIRVYSVTSGKHSKTFKGSLGDSGTLIKLVLDNSGSYVSTSCTDKNMYLVEYATGETVATMGGHSELVTGMKVSNDGKHLISVSGDGCIFIWRLPGDITQNIVSKMADREREYRREQFSVSTEEEALDNARESDNSSIVDSNANDINSGDYSFNVTQLPFWAKKQIAEDVSISRTTEKRVDYPKGRWAQRLGDTQGITVRSIYDSDSLIPFPQDKNRLMMESDSSKDSSLEGSGPDVQRVTGFRKDTIIISKQERMTCISDPSHDPDRAASPSQVGSGMMMRRGMEVPGVNATTDDSSVGSPKHEDGGYTGDDGDVEDYSEAELEDGGESTEPEQPEPKLMYLPQNADNDREFTVNATDEAELRKSQRRSKKRPNDLALPPLSTMSVSGSQESDEDDDVSTPSADKNITSGLSCSMESIDQVGQREHFLKSNFESLEGNTEGSTETEKHRPPLEAKPSFSSKFLTRSSSRNAHLIQEAKTMKPEAKKKREELQRQLEETRKKLQSIGYKSNLRSSRSITDLSQLSDQEGRSSSRGVLREDPSSSSSSSAAGGGGGGLRRACSLSDLSKSGGTSSQSGPRRLLPNPPVQVSGRKSSPAKSSPRAAVPPVRVNAVAPLHRSSSATQLPQSDSENEVMLKGGKLRKISGTSPSAMRPTISSSNKVLNKAGAPGRRRLTAATSATDLRQHHHPDDSSSEEGDHTRSTSIERSKTTTSKVTVTASRRSSLANHRASSERDISGLNKTARDVTQRLTAVTKTRQETVMRRSTTTTQPRKPKHSGVNNHGDPSSGEHLESPMKELSGYRMLPAADVSSSALSRELVEQAAYTVQSSCDDLVQLYRRVSLATDLPETVRTEYMGILWGAALGSQRSLAPLSTWAGKTQSDSGNPMVHMMQQYSDLLVNMVQQRMGNSGPS